MSFVFVAGKRFVTHPCSHLTRRLTVPIKCSPPTWTLMFYYFYKIGPFDAELREMNSGVLKCCKSDVDLIL